MITISVCMIVKNEEDVLARCLESIEGIADEIVVVDTGSSDRTREIAAQFTERVFDFAWIDDFSAARNFSFSKAQMDYCMWLDADDVIRGEDREGFLELKRTLSPEVDVVMLPYHTGFDAAGNPSFSYYRERLLRRTGGFRWEGAIHEAIAPAGNIVYADTCAVTHRKIHPSDPDRNLNIFEKMLSAGKTLNPREQFYYARELYYHKRFSDAASVYEAFLDGGMGWVENCIGACQILAYCYYELGEEKKALAALLRSLEFDLPRAELCCDIGGHFFRKNQSRQFSGMSLRPGAPGKTNPEDLFSQTATDTSHICSCASAVTGWGICRRQSAIMNWQEKSSQTTRPFFRTMPILLPKSSKPPSPFFCVLEMHIG